MFCNETIHIKFTSPVLNENVILSFPSHFSELYSSVLLAIKLLLLKFFLLLNSLLWFLSNFNLCSEKKREKGKLLSFGLISENFKPCSKPLLYLYLFCLYFSYFLSLARLRALTRTSLNNTLCFAKLLKPAFIPIFSNSDISHFPLEFSN